MNRLVAGVVALLVVAGLAIGVAKAVLHPVERSERLQAPAPAAEKLDGAAQVPIVAAANQETAMQRLEQAAAENKYLFAFFWKTDNEQTGAMKKVFGEAVAKISERAASAIILVTDPAEEEIVNKFGLDRAPMPLALAIAPNGAVMGGFPNEFTVEALLGALGSPATEKCTKCLQNGKLVFLCVQNASTKSNEEALQGVRDFKAEAQYADLTEIVKLDPADSAEASFLGDLKVDPQTKVAITAFIAPPGVVVAEFEGPTEKNQLIAALQQAGSACGPGGSCGPSGCGPQ